MGIDGTTLKPLPDFIDELKGVTRVIAKAPVDGTLYGRQDEDWVEVPVGIDDAPADRKQYARKDGEWAEVEASSGGATPAAFINRGTFDPQKLDYDLNDVVDFEGRFWVCVVANTQEFPFFKHPNAGVQTVDWRCLTPMVGGENVERNGLNVIYGNSSLINDGMTTVTLATILQTMAQRIQALEAA